MRKSLHDNKILRHIVFIGQKEKKNASMSFSENLLKHLNR